MRQLLFTALAATLAVMTGCQQESGQLQHTSHALAAQALDEGGFVIAQAERAEDLQRARFGEPTDFWWVRLELDEAAEAAMRSADGVTIDLSEERAGSFSQSYWDICNPRLPGDPPRCWLQEHYEFGEPNLTGRISAKLQDGVLEVSYTVAWEGITDRWEGEPGWLRHITESGHIVDLGKGASDE